MECFREYLTDDHNASNVSILFFPRNRCSPDGDSNGILPELATEMVPHHILLPTVHLGPL